MHDHLFRKNKPCCAVKRNIQLTDEIKVYIIQNRIFVPLEDQPVNPATINDTINSSINKIGNDINKTITESMAKLSVAKKKTKKKIPQSIRSKVWRQYFNSLDAQCPLCETVISFDMFDCGHIKSEKNGGDINLENLIPICAKCNRSMAATDMDEYCRTYNIPMPSPRTVYEITND